MATRNIVPRADGEGELGTAAKSWNKLNVKHLYVEGVDVGVDGTPVGRVVFDSILRTGYIKANGAAVADASTAIPRLLAFVQANPSLLAADAAAYSANVGLYLYDSGTDTLTLPTYIERFVEGGNSVESVEAGLPNITGKHVEKIQTEQGDFTGCFTEWGPGTGTNHACAEGNLPGTYGVIFDASNSSAIYQNNITTVQPAAITMIPQIRY